MQNENTAQNSKANLIESLKLIYLGRSPTYTPTTNKDSFTSLYSTALPSAPLNGEGKEMSLLDVKTHSF